MKDRIRENSINYVLVGDYYIPDWEPPVEECSTGKYGCMYSEYLKENNPMMYNDLILSCQLWTYLTDINEQAQSRLQLIMKQMQEVESVNGELKEKDHMAWIRAVNSICHLAEEIVLNKIVYR